MLNVFLNDLDRGIEFGLVTPGGAVLGARLAGMLYPLAKYGYLELARYEFAISASYWNLLFAHTPLEVMLPGIGIYPYHCTSRQFRPRGLKINFDYLEEVVGRIIEPGLPMLRKSLSKIYAGVTNAKTGEGEIICAQSVENIFRLGSASSNMVGKPIKVNKGSYVDGGYFFSQTELLRASIERLPRVKHIVMLAPSFTGLECRIGWRENLALRALGLLGSKSLLATTGSRAARCTENMRFLWPHLSQVREPFIHILKPAGPKIRRTDRRVNLVHEAVRASANATFRLLGLPEEDLVLPR